MRRITLGMLLTVTVLVLLFSYHTSTNPSQGRATASTVITVGQTPSATPSTATPSNSTDSSGSTGTGSTTSPVPTASSSPSSSTSSGSKTYKGSTVQTRYGAIQVTITVTNGKVTSVSVPTYPNHDGRDQEINSYALPILAQETLTAQSANIDTVSGATYTSNGYKESLQAALDSAHLS